MDTAIALMAKNPVPGLVKTRLAQDLGEQKALEIYLQLLKRTILTMNGQNVADKIIYHSPELLHDASWASNIFNHELQEEGDLGDRILDVFQFNLDRYKKLIIIGADCPGLKSKHLDKAKRALDIVDVVLGPSDDGGYYLIGLKKAHPSLFENIPWSTETVFEETLSRIKALHLSLYLLPELYDIDDVEDWKRWQNSQGV